MKLLTCSWVWLVSMAVLCTAVPATAQQDDWTPEKIRSEWLGKKLLVRGSWCAPGADAPSNGCAMSAQPRPQALAVADGFTRCFEPHPDRIRHEARMAG